MFKAMRNIVRLTRPAQWIKNGFVLLPVFFGGGLFDPAGIYAAVVTCVAYCFTASSVYCFNDIIDAEADKHHPVKCQRPIASGAVSMRSAYVLMFVMLLLGVATLFMLGDKVLPVGCVLVVYYVLNLAYCAKLKQYAIIDVCVVAFGFVLRLVAGGTAADIALSHWIVLMTFLLTLFLSLAKRRDDVLRMEQTGEPPRKNTIRYSLTFINEAMTITASVTLVCYIMYTVSKEVTAAMHTDKLYVTSFLVLLGLLRYLQITIVDKKSGNPTRVILHDRFMQIVVLAWILSFLFVIYVM